MLVDVELHLRSRIPLTNLPRFMTCYITYYFYLKVAILIFEDPARGLILSPINFKSAGADLSRSVGSLRGTYRRWSWGIPDSHVKTDPPWD